MSDATLARMEHGKYVGVREESRRDGVWALRKRTLYVICNINEVEDARMEHLEHLECSLQPSPR